MPKPLPPDDDDFAAKLDPAAYTPPPDAEEYKLAFEANTRITGYYDKVTTHLPCPFCAFPGFQRLRITSTAEDMQKEVTCRACGRSGKTLLNRNEPGLQEFEFVQTGGDPPPDWLIPAPRRI